MFENIKRITRVGAPSFNVPPTMTALEALEAMNIDHTTMDVKIEGDNLILAAQSGSKGAVNVRVTDDGRLVPLGNATFPTDADIENIAKLFPEDNLFETLENPVELQKYFTALKENAEVIAEAEKAERIALRGTEIDRLKAAAEAVRVYAVDPENKISHEMILNITTTANKLLVLLEMALASELEDKAKAEAEAKREADLAALRAANPGLTELDAFITE